MNDDDLDATVQNLIQDPRMIERRIAAMVEQRFVLERLLGDRPPPTRRERLRRRVQLARERVALWVAPWLRSP